MYQYLVRSKLHGCWSHDHVHRGSAQTTLGRSPVDAHKLAHQLAAGAVRLPFTYCLGICMTSLKRDTGRLELNSCGRFLFSLWKVLCLAAMAAALAAAGVGPLPS